MDVYKRLLILARGQIPRFIVAAFCMALVGGATAAAAFLIKPALDDIFLNRNEKSLYWIPLAVIFMYFLKAAAQYVQHVLMNYIGNRIVADLRDLLYRKIQSQSLSFFTKHPTGTLISRVLNDVGLIYATVSNTLTNIFKDTFTLIALVGVVFYRDWKLALIALVAFPAAIYPVVLIGRKVRKISTKTQVTMAGLTDLLQETIAGNRIVKAFGMESYEMNRFSRENERLFRLAIKNVMTKSLSSPLIEIFAGLGIAVIVFYGGYQVIRGATTPGTFFSFLAALLMIYEPAKRLTNVNNEIQQGIAAATRVFSVIDTIPEIQSRGNAVILKPLTKEIALRNVSFAYEETPVLKGINLTIRAGEAVAFVGMSGGGKTTLANLIPRFYDVKQGAVLIDGHDIRDVTLQSLIAQIGIVTQQTFLFNDTVRNNIAYGDIQASEEKIIEAAKAAHAHKFIMNLPNGYDTGIGELGTKLSGGERQRIAIARALLKDAPILILDEATSSLDTESEREVQAALENLMRGRTTLVIAHRLSTIRRADRIAVLMNGEIIEEGNHEELIARQGEYYRLYQMQFREENEEEQESQGTGE
ncbi:MAG: lipid A export permease/ATP-binding protein MsbA [Syntrophales bacterium]|jgi:subfamily B ATP-binding cassette protein MsbA|nr:lipid A export permease/ATP-binding protein MsbA [Syntrophales bacterium]NLN59970.1 lipid A export permease/ATP-binding protein MsbA [Deltaproteobacteria bacterium]